MKHKILLYLTRLAAAVKVLQSDTYFIATADRRDKGEKVNIAHSDLKGKDIQVISSYLTIKSQMAIDEEYNRQAVNN